MATSAYTISQHQISQSLKARGFTLLEMLIACSLLSVMLVLIFAGLRLCANTWQAADTRLNRINQLASCYQFLQQHLSTALPLSNAQLKQTGSVTEPLVFRGEAQSLRFASMTRLGLKVFVLKKQQDQLMVSVNDFFAKQDQHEDLVLLSHVQGVKLSYFAQDALNQGHWQDDWLEKSKAPDLLRLSLRLDNGLIVPDLVFAIKAP